MTKTGRTLILDNGACDLKVNYSSEEKPRVLPNAIFKSQNDKRRNYISDELDLCQYKSRLYRSLPFEKGYLVNWNTELEIWDRLFGKDVMNVNFEETNLLLTDPSLIIPAIKNVADEVAFEVYQFASLNLTSAPSLIASYKDCSIVVDSGFSFTHIVPFYQGNIIQKAIKRIDIGGKALTNQLKEWISYRQIDVRDETYVINQCKEDACFVTTDINKDMKISSQRGKANTILCDYILPDFINLNRGIVTEHSRRSEDEQKIELSVERFSVPELLFNPSDVGLQQAGISETVMQVISDVEEYCPEANIRSNANIICAGGNVMFPNFIERICQDLQPNFYDEDSFDIEKPEDPVTFAWSCAQKLLNSKNSELQKGFVTKKEFAEHGSNIFLKKQKRV